MNDRNGPQEMGTVDIYHSQQRTFESGREVSRVPDLHEKAI